MLGAPEMVLPDDPLVIASMETAAARGHRVLLLARAAGDFAGDALPAGLEAVALVGLTDRIRPDAAQTLRYFAAQGVAAKVISGDHPQTVAAIAAQVGLPGADRVVDARTLSEDPEELAEAMERGTIFGRVTPHQKRAMVAALQSRGHVVAMTGDGVNDVLALKDADIGIAMGSGAAASRAVAQLVLLDGSFATLPSVVAEGRRVISNIERVANLFLTKTVYAFLLAILVGVFSRPFPFVPRHLTLVGSLTIGIPSFFLALAPSAQRARPGFVRRVVSFALPVGGLAAAATYCAYELAIYEGLGLIEARTLATLVLVSIGLFALIINARPLTPQRRLLIGAMAGIFLIILASPALAAASSSSNCPRWWCCSPGWASSGSPAGSSTGRSGRWAGSSRCRCCSAPRWAAPAWARPCAGAWPGCESAPAASASRSSPSRRRARPIPGPPGRPGPGRGLPPVRSSGHARRATRHHHHRRSPATASSRCAPPRTTPPTSPSAWKWPGPGAAAGSTTWPWSRWPKPGRTTPSATTETWRWSSPPTAWPSSRAPGCASTGDGLALDNPNRPPVAPWWPGDDASLEARVAAVLDHEINPSIAGHGGWAQLVEVDGRDVHLSLGGGCQGCGMAQVTLRQGIEVALRHWVPDIGVVHDVTDHTSGENPYY